MAQGGEFPAYTVLEPELNESHPMPGRAESVTSHLDRSEKQPQPLRGLATLKVGRGWEESERQMRGEPTGDSSSRWDLPVLDQHLHHRAGESEM